MKAENGDSFQPLRFLRSDKTIVFAFAIPNVRPLDGSVGHATPVSIESTSAAKQPFPLELTMPAPEQLARARFVMPSAIELEFADGFRSSLAIELLDMPFDRINWPTLKVSPDGEKVVVKGAKGGLVPIDSATLRYLVDERYAAKIDKSIKSLHIPIAEADEIAKLLKISRDLRWSDVGNEDDLFE